MHKQSISIVMTIGLMLGAFYPVMPTVPTQAMQQYVHNMSQFLPHQNSIEIDQNLTISNEFLRNITFTYHKKTTTLQDFLCKVLDIKELYNAFISRQGIITLQVKTQQDYTKEIAIDPLQKCIYYDNTTYRITRMNHMYCIRLTPEEFVDFIREHHLDQHLKTYVRTALFKKILAHSGVFVALYAQPYHLLELMSVDTDKQTEYLYGNGLGNIPTCKKNARLEKHKKHLQPIIEQVQYNQHILLSLLNKHANTVT